MSEDRDGGQGRAEGSETGRHTMEAALRQGRDHESQGDLAGAERYYAQADDLGSGDGASDLGLLSYERGEVAGAEAALRRADERGHADGTFRLGVLLQESGRTDEAVAVYRRAAERGNVSAMYNLGGLLEECGDRAGAQVVFEQIVADGTDQDAVRRARQRLATLEGQRDADARSGVGVLREAAQQRGVPVISGTVEELSLGLAAEAYRDGKGAAAEDMLRSLIEHGTPETAAKAVLLLDQVHRDRGDPR